MPDERLHTPDCLGVIRVRSMATLDTLGTDG